jgi:hypothetical protein
VDEELVSLTARIPRAVLCELQGFAALTDRKQMEVVATALSEWLQIQRHADHDLNRALSTFVTARIVQVPRPGA